MILLSDLAGKYKARFGWLALSAMVSMGLGACGIGLSKRGPLNGRLVLQRQAAFDHCGLGSLWMPRLYWPLLLAASCALASPGVWAQPAQPPGQVASDAQPQAPAAVPGEAAPQTTSQTANESANETTNETAIESPLQYGVSLGYSRYAEDLMRLSGPSLGLHVRWRQPFGLSRWTLRAQGLASVSRYTSPVSGSLDNSRSWATTWQALHSSVDSMPWGLAGQLQTGLELQTDYNDLRGLTSNGHAGYERERFGLWALAAYQSPVLPSQALGAQHWRMELGVLLRGLAVSYLLQANSSLGTARNNQNMGVLFRTERTYRLQQGDLSPYMGVTWVDKSDVQIVGAKKAYEPVNTTWQLGAKWFWK